MGDGPFRRKLDMKNRILLMMAVLGALTAPAFARSHHGGQYPAPRSVAAESALPECGFAATESWGSNGFQYCDPRNIHGSY
jgi:hypothetical protein